MLKELRIRNFAIIESVSLPLEPALNVLSGETGAGKSIIVGALGLLLGERANADLVRTGSEKATVEGVFDVSDVRGFADLADERGIEIEDGLLVLKREVTAAGRGRAWANGATVTASVLADLGRRLVSLHGQHEAQTLLDPDSQRMILDAFGGATELAAKVKESYDGLTLVNRQIEQLTTRRTEIERRADYLRHVVDEIEKANVKPGEDVKLEDEARRLENADELRTLSTGLVELLAGEEQGALNSLDATRRTLAGILRIDPAAASMQELLDTGYYALQELSRAAELYAGGVDLDPSRLEQVRQRRDLLYGLLKKYGPSLEKVIETGATARAELDTIDSAGFDLAALDARRKSAEATLAREAGKLSDARATAAKKLAKAVVPILKELGMPDGKFAVALISRDTIGADGAEAIEFRVALNVGHEERALSRVASGGELSRVMLALKTILAKLDAVPTLIFDEVDAGIGGKVGLQVGDTLRRVARDHQVFVISHLPQIAARADNHIVVAKGAKSGVTTADITVLDGSDRVTEIARMLGGDPGSKVSQAHARELLSSGTA